LTGLDFDPNGMGMDLLRSCYSQRLNYITNDAVTTALARWYFCAPDALCFPGDHAFGSPTWDQIHPTVTGLGFDATGPRGYSNGRRSNASKGQMYAGPLQYFEVGQPSIGSLDRGSSGTPVECLEPPYGLAGGGLAVPCEAGKGGKKAGGVATIVIPTVTIACFVPHSPWLATMTLTFTLVPDIGAPPLGPFVATVPWDSAYTGPRGDWHGGYHFPVSIAGVIYDCIFGCWSFFAGAEASIEPVAPFYGIGMPVVLHNPGPVYGAGGPSHYASPFEFMAFKNYTISFFAT